MRRREFSADACKAACLVAIGAQHAACGGGNAAEPLTPLAPSPGPALAQPTPTPASTPAPASAQVSEPSSGPAVSTTPPSEPEILLVPQVPVSVTARTAIVQVGPGSPLAATGGVAHASFERDATPWDFLIVRTGERAFTVLSAICAHQGCLVLLMTAAPVFVCPCHGSRYDIRGAVVRGPATDPLRSFPAQYVDGLLTITFQA
jgi:Rieske Fe-S protein